MNEQNEKLEYEAKRKRLTMIHSKFENEHQCTACGGYFLNSEKDIDRCPRCIRLNRVSKIEEAKDVLYKEVNVNELSKQIAELQAKVIELTKTNEEKKPKEFKPKSCANCDKEFTPSSPAQKICTGCRDELVS
jgi:hypothetical protein